mmetsp:Transcript_101517/g.183183  ORF Transcript_101517/g.183183 Transcript_101517/m.183183 type:complete len:461 (+) Transcript_101517:115-1497(+)
MARKALGDVTNTVRGEESKPKAQDPKASNVEDQLGLQKARPRRSRKSGGGLHELRDSENSPASFAPRTRVVSAEASTRSGSSSPSGRCDDQGSCCTPEPPSKRGGCLTREGVPDLIADVAVDLHQLWAQSAAEGGARIQFALQKFGRLGPPPFVVALLNPPANVPPPPPRLKKEAQGPSWRSAGLEDPVAWLDDHLKDLVAEGSLLRPCHEQSERVRPSSEAIIRCLPAEDREQVVLWVAQVCISGGLNDTILQSSTQLFDRYCTTFKDKLPMERLHLVVIAILGISLKMAGNSAGGCGSPGQLRSLMEHLGQSQFTRQDIIHAEIEVLQALQFDVASPSPVDFLDGLCLPFLRPSRPAGPPSPVMCLASFLLQLSLGDAVILHRYPYAALTAGAVYIALWCTQAAPGHYVALLEEAAFALVGCQSAVSDELESQQVYRTPRGPGHAGPFPIQGTVYVEI